MEDGFLKKKKKSGIYLIPMRASDMGSSATKEVDRMLPYHTQYAAVAGARLCLVVMLISSLFVGPCESKDVVSVTNVNPNSTSSSARPSRTKHKPKPVHMSGQENQNRYGMLNYHLFLHALE
jgi:hypothetical protein